MMTKFKDHSGKNGASIFQRYLAVVLAVILGVVVTILLFSVVEDRSRSIVQKEFDLTASTHAANIQRGVDRVLEHVASIGALYDASVEVERHEFRAFTQSIASGHQEIQALEWIPRVKDSERHLFEQSARADGFADFEFTERNEHGKVVKSGRREKYLPVYFMEPLTGNEAALGFDLTSDPNRLQALERARDTGTMVSTVRLSLVQETGTEYGFLIFKPVYFRGMTPVTIKERRENLKGFAVGVFRIRDLVEVSLEMSMALGIDIFLYDNKAPEDRRFLYLHRSRTRKAADTKSDHLEPDVKSGIVWRGVLNVAGRQWSVHAFPAPAFFEMHRRRTSWMVLAGGLLFTALLGAYLFSSINRTAKIEALATDLSLANKKLQQEIVEHEKAELARQESELRFRSLVETTSDWVWEVDRNAVYRYASPKIFDLLGYEPEEVLGRTPFDLMPPEEARRVRGIYGTIVAAQRPFRFLENTNFHKDGHTVVLESSGVPVYDNNGAFRGYRGIDRDITERKRLEEEILRAQKLESLGVLAGGLAHDFNNLLTSVLGNISLAKFHTEPDGEADGLLTEAEKASLRARDLTQQLLTFSKGGAPVLKTSTIGNLIKDSSNFALRGSNVRCDLHLPADLQTVEVDEGQMSRVIHNLVINADQAMPQGGEIRIKCENIEIGGEDPVPLKHGPYVKISIKDQGAGIPDEHLHRIFDPYFTTKQKGSGLGLAGAYSIIKRHHGHMTVESELGVGTLFTLYLPAAKKDLFQEHDIMEGIYRGEGKILLMDDEEFIRKVAGTMLVQLGYEVEYAADGAQAIELYSSARDLGTPFRAVIMDLTVPGGMGGEEAMKKLLEIDSDVRAIVSSGYADDPVMANFSEFGFKGVVTKPYRIKDLSEVVQKVLDSGSIA